MNINELIALGNNVAALSEIAGVINTNDEITISVKGGNNEPKSIVLAGQAREKILNLVSAELQSVMKVYTDINLKLTQHNTNVDEVVMDLVTKVVENKKKNKKEKEENKNINLEQEISVERRKKKDGCC